MALQRPDSICRVQAAMPSSGVVSLLLQSF